ncbi:exosortase 1 [Thauera sp. 28]|nr:exosortase 1 [Thauera sp. 28]
MNMKEGAMSVTNASHDPGQANAAGDAPARRLHLAVLAVGLLWLLFWYRDTFMAMVHIWDRSETFAHGFVIAPISAWLVWRRRHFIRNLPIEPSLLGVVLGVGAGFAWLLGELASVDAVSQFAVVGMLVAFVWAVMGTAVIRTYAFPIGFLFFMVPFGEFMFPSMMDWTANFIIWAVRASGVPVYAEGYNLVIPSGRWEVVEGCSGVRYLMASVVVGSLFAYLNYTSTRRRLIFVAASIVLPVFANWLRAYGIVMLGHLTDNKLAAGADHLIYGWVFFGIIIMILFWVGSRWQEPEESAPAAPVSTPTTAGTARAGRAGWLVAAVVVVSMWNPVLAFIDRQGQHGPVAFAAFSLPATWQPASVASLPEWEPSYSGMRGKLTQTWAGEDGAVGLYVGFYRNQGPGEELINFDNRVLVSKHPVWRRTGESLHSIQIGDRAVPLRGLTMLSNDGRRMMVWYTNWIDGRWTVSPYVAKVYLALSRLTGEGDDSAVVMFSTAYVEGHGETGEARLKAFIEDAGPALQSMLQQTAER